MSQQGHVIAEALTAEIALVLGSLLGADAAAQAFEGPVQPEWRIPCRLDGPAPGVFCIGVPKEDAAALAARLLMSDSEPTEADVADALTEVGGQAFAALVARGTVAGLAGALDRPSRLAQRPAAPVTTFRCVVDSALTTRFACWFEPAAEKTAAASRAVLPAASAMVGIGSGESAAVAVPDNLDVILDIDMPLSVRFGEAVLSLDLLTRLGPGSLIELSRQPDDPVDVLINGRLVARGEVVVVSGNYGVRITEVMSAAERLRSVGA